MKFIDSFWFNSARGSFGVVVGEDDNTGKRKAYGSVVSGFSQKADEVEVMEGGASVSAAFLREIVDKLDPPAPPAPDTTRADIFKEIEKRFPDATFAMKGVFDDEAEWLTFSGQVPGGE